MALTAWVREKVAEPVMVVAVPVQVKPVVELKVTEPEPMLEMSER